MPSRRRRAAAVISLTAVAATSAALALPDRSQPDRVVATAGRELDAVSARLHAADPVPTTTTAPPPPTPTEPPQPPAPEPAAAAPEPEPTPAAPAEPEPAEAPSTVTASPAALGAEEAHFLELANAERSQAGLAPLQADGGATALARDWSASQAAQNTLAHNPNLADDVSTRVTPYWTTIGENVGVGGSVDELHAEFMASSAHRANILGGAYDLVGIGVVHSGGRLWVTVVFVGL